MRKTFKHFILFEIVSTFYLNSLKDIWIDSMYVYTAA